MDTQSSGLSARTADAIPFPLGCPAPHVIPTPYAMQEQPQPSRYGLKLLDVAPHHRVLDMYGSGRQRMSMISDELDERGELVANISGALSLESVSLRHTPDNVTMTRLGDERLLPQEMGAFDRVLLDIPAVIGRHQSPRQRCERLVSLLLRAIKLCREGGRVVYMTHGHSTQSNEMVIDQVLNDAHKGVALHNITLSGVIGRPAGTCHGGQQLDPRIARAVHVMDCVDGDEQFMAVFECGQS
ncbi:16S rRNA methyltransferase RsmF [Kushneria avicenniae]|uniref:16S rRNA methyltransferase RsmF n=1 Tax=Kushneria avicenniae TaxID=402385 RepID=A0A1I1GLE6_9GAMM|nr:hypothetical protein [Kushneria avicenniae]SFC10000.1 16S rRNA methyltransferase RsmF [Kushneria avicenniae]